MEQMRKTQPQRESGESESFDPNDTRELLDDIETLLDEVDGILEDNAEVMAQCQPEATCECGIPIEECPAMRWAVLGVIILG